MTVHLNVLDQEDLKVKPVMASMLLLLLLLWGFSYVLFLALVDLFLSLRGSCRGSYKSLRRGVVVGGWFAHTNDMVLRKLHPWLYERLRPGTSKTHNTGVLAKHTSQCSNHCLVSTGTKSKGAARGQDVAGNEPIRSRADLKANLLIRLTLKRSQLHLTPDTHLLLCSPSPKSTWVHVPSAALNYPEAPCDPGRGKLRSFCCGTRGLTGYPRSSTTNGATLGGDFTSRDQPRPAIILCGVPQSRTTAHVTRIVATRDTCYDLRCEQYPFDPRHEGQHSATSLLAQPNAAASHVLQLSFDSIQAASAPSNMLCKACDSSFLSSDTARLRKQS